MSDVFQNLYSKNVNDYTVEKESGKDKLTYLSWANAWAEVKKEYPDASYQIKKFEDNLPYVFDEKTGYMVFTEVTIENQTHEMWLPVMNHQNLAMKDKPYQKKFKYSTANVDSATMFDINKTIMRCLTKNLAMFGLGLYIFSGEDFPEAPPVEVINDEDLRLLNKKIDEIAELEDGDKKKNIQKMNNWLKGQAQIKEINELPKELLDGLIKKIDKMIASAKSKQENEQGSLLEGNTTTAKSGSD